MHPYPSLSSLQKRSSIASERPYSHKYAISSYDSGLRNFNNGIIINYNNLQSNYYNNYTDTFNRVYSPTNTALDPNDAFYRALNLGYITPGVNFNSNFSFNAPIYYSAYLCRYPLYGLDWTSSGNQPFAKIALSTYREDTVNKLEILHGTPKYVDVNKFKTNNKEREKSKLRNIDRERKKEIERVKKSNFIQTNIKRNNSDERIPPDQLSPTTKIRDDRRESDSDTDSYNDSDNYGHTNSKKKQKNNDNIYSFQRAYEYKIKYPVTRLQWDPSMNLLTNDVERFATTSECLRIYEVQDCPEPEKDDKITFNKSGSTESSINKESRSENEDDGEEKETAKGNENENETEKNEEPEDRSPYTPLSPPPPNYKLVEKAAFTNSKSKNLNQLPPMSSFDWNKLDPTHLITCSIDTTCTVWNLTKETFVAKTQLIAHDSEVFDVKYLFGDTNVFTSCSSDGSVRLFDLRNLEQSTIIYEKSDSLSPRSISPTTAIDDDFPLTRPKQNHPMDNSEGILVRISTSNYNANQIAVLEANSNHIMVLDLRKVGMPLYRLNDHQGTVNSIAWHPTKNMLLSGGDDCQVLIHDFSKLNSRNTDKNNSNNSNYSSNQYLPNYSFPTENEINYVSWSPDGDWVGFNAGKRFQACQVDF